MHWNDITLTHWIDNGSVTIASSLPHIIQEPDQVDRKIKDGDGKWVTGTIQCPKIVKEYNKYMGGVDLGRFIASWLHRFMPLCHIFNFS